MAFLSNRITLNGTFVVCNIRPSLDGLNDGAVDVDYLELKPTLQLISESLDPSTGDELRSNRVPVKDCFLAAAPSDVAVKFKVKFSVSKDFGSPGAVLVRNDLNPFYLVSFTIEMPDKSLVFFPCNSWVYNYTTYDHADRVFFSNKVYLPSETPAGLKIIRQIELFNLQGYGSGERKEGERIYDYATYNDLGNPDVDQALSRPTLGGGEALPYPRRCRTGRCPTKRDPGAEMPLPIRVDPYVPKDEEFSTMKNSGFLDAARTSIIHGIVPALEGLSGDLEFKSFAEVMDLYVHGIDLHGVVPEKDAMPEKDVIKFPKFPKPQVIQANEEAWMCDEEFARETLAGLNPMVIQTLKEFPPRGSAITAKDIQDNLEGYTPQEALESKKLFMLDNHDIFLPYLVKFNKEKDNKAYASRALFFLTERGILKPVAIELSLPPNSRVFVPPKAPKSGERDWPPKPPKSGERDWLWELAKAYVSSSDTVIHQIASHWLRTHACIEPFIIATHRQLSALHPINLVLLPHYKNTMHINAKARNALINANGVVERTTTPGRYALEVSSVIYDKLWQFNEQGLPADLVKRGMAENDDAAKHGLKLAIEDYPYAVDGLDIWSALKQWMEQYVAIFYKDDEAVSRDEELQKWWTEIRTVGHGDKKDATWWPVLNNVTSLSETLTTLIWVASAHHAAVDFGQYAYEGYPPNRPTRTHKAIPERDSDEYKELSNNPEKFFLSCITNKLESATGMVIVETLSTHDPEEVYLGQPLWENWTSNKKVLEAFNQFKQNLIDAEKKMKERNKDPSNYNRYGPVKVPYTLLYPSSKSGLTGRGIPTSISI